MILPLILAFFAAPASAPTWPTEVVAVAPPPGWVTSVWRGGTFELGEFTPKGQEGGRYVDLLGYSVLPLVDGVPKTEAQVAPFERLNTGKSCPRTFLRERPRADGWRDMQAFCLDRSGPGSVEISFSTARAGKQGYYRIWRDWRGTPAELTAMLKARTGLDLAPVADGEVDEAAADQALIALAPLFQADLKDGEVCDLTQAQVCAALSRPLPPEAKPYFQAKPYVAGFYASSLSRISRNQFREMMQVDVPDDGTPNRVIGVWAANDPDLTDPDRMMQAAMAIGVGQAADGGGFILMAPADAKADVAQARALAVRTSRQLWQKGFDPSTVVVTLPKIAQ